MLRRLSALAALPVLLAAGVGLPACQTAPQADDVPEPVAADTAAALPVQPDMAVATLTANTEAASSRILNPAPSYDSPTVSDVANPVAIFLIVWWGLPARLAGVA